MQIITEMGEFTPSKELEKQIWFLISGQRQPRPVNQAVAVVNTRPYKIGKIFPKGAKIWTQENYDKLVSRYEELKKLGLPTSQYLKILAKELDRTTGSVAVKLHSYRHGKVFHPKKRWGMKKQIAPETAMTKAIEEFTL